MATETLNINAINEVWSGASGAATDIDEPIASADGNLYGPGAQGDGAEFGLTNPVSITDADTVTNVSVTVRLKKGGGAGQEQAEIRFLIAGDQQGQVTTGNLTTSFANYGPLNLSPWNFDWTLAELQDAEFRVTPLQSGMPGTNAVDIDCMDVVVTFTPAAGPITGTAADTAAAATDAAIGTVPVVGTASDTAAAATDAVTGTVKTLATAGDTAAAASDVATANVTVEGTVSDIAAAATDAATAANPITATVTDQAAQATDAATANVAADATATVADVAAAATDAVTAANPVVGIVADTAAPASDAVTAVNPVVGTVADIIAAVADAAQATVGGDIAATAADSPEVATDAAVANVPVVASVADQPEVAIDAATANALIEATAADRPAAASDAVVAAAVQNAVVADQAAPAIDAATGTVADAGITASVSDTAPAAGDSANADALIAATASEIIVAPSDAATAAVPITASVSDVPAAVSDAATAVMPITATVTDTLAPATDSVTGIVGAFVHLAERIMDAVVAAVTGLVTTGANVHRARAYPVQVADVPALLVWQGEDSAQTELLGDAVTSLLNVHIDAVAREPADQIDTTLNLIREEVTVALMADYTLGLAYVEGIMERDAEEPAIVGEGDAPAAQMRMNWDVTYQHSRTDPAI